MAEKRDWQRGAPEALTTGMRIAFGSVVGLLVVPIAVVATGFVAVGLGRGSPCHGRSDFLSSAVFGAMVFAQWFGLPALAAGLVVGAVVGAVLDRWKASRRTIVVATTAVGTIGVALVFGLIWAFRS
jgi:hypothetical protein